MYIYIYKYIYIYVCICVCVFVCVFVPACVFRSSSLEMFSKKGAIQT